MEQKRASQPRQHLTSPIYSAYDGHDMLQFLALPESDPPNGMSPESHADTYYGEQIEPHHVHPYQEQGQLLRIDVGFDASTPNIDIDSSYLCAPSPGNGGYRSHPASPSIASSRGSSPYPSSAGSLSPYCPTSPLTNLSPAALSSSSFESFPDMSLLTYSDHVGSSSDFQLASRTTRAFYDVGSNPSSSYPSSSSLPLPPTPSQPPRLARQDTLVDQTFHSMEHITREMDLHKRSSFPKQLRDNMRNRLLADLHSRLPKYASLIDGAASKAIGTMANREASQRRKRKKGTGFFCLLCKEGRDFTTKDNFMTHIRVHFGAKLSECTGCGHEFPNKTVPKRHRTTCEQNRKTSGDRQHSEQSI
ncbi:hypothetical protein BJ165DRAFT_1021804 [Panaeolus papilionaceus]|nr:hypothetical protein BJ165DRAFT_1021804 [Panaeolus papilionaceus]